MKKTFLSFLFLPLVISNTSSANVSTQVQNEVSGDNATVRTEIRNEVNGQETTVEVDKPGSVKVEIKNGDVKIITSPSITPMVTISQKASGDTVQVEIKQKEEVIKDINKQVESIRVQISSFFNDIISRISGFFRF